MPNPFIFISLLKCLLHKVYTPTTLYNTLHPSIPDTIVVYTHVYAYVCFPCSYEQFEGTVHNIFILHPKRPAQCPYVKKKKDEISD